MQTAFNFMTHGFRLFLFVFSASYFAGCAALPVQAPSEKQEVVTRREQIIAARVAQIVEKQVQVDSYPEAERWLCALTSQLGATAGATSRLFMTQLPQRCSLIRPVDKRWLSLVVPSQALYVSTALLKEAHFEAEVAAEIAIQLGHIVRNHFGVRLEQEKWSEFTSEADLGVHLGQTQVFGPAGILTYNDQEHLDAVESAVELMYQAGFDPRAVISLLQIYEKNPAHSSESSELLQKLMEKARRTIALRAPLRNPILRTAEFFKIQKGLKRRE